MWIDHEPRQPVVRAGMTHPLVRIDEAQPFRRHFLTAGGIEHHHANQIIDQGEDRQFLSDARFSFTAKHIHVHRCFEITDFGFDFPALQSKLEQILRPVNPQAEYLYMA